MKNYTITVNGNVYDVVVEEGATTGAPIAAPVVAKKAAPVAAPVAAPKAPVAPAKSAGAGSVKVEAGAAARVRKARGAASETANQVARKKGRTAASGPGQSPKKRNI